MLIEGTSADVDIIKLRGNLEKVEGVAGIHDLHVWSLTSGVNAMSVHAVLSNDYEYNAVMKRVHALCTKEYKISHVTVQTECEGYAEHETHL